MQTCNHCGETKPETEFHKNKNSPTGYRADCKECRKAESHDYYWTNHDREIAKLRLRKFKNPNWKPKEPREPTFCAHCHKVKTREDFRNDRARKTGLAAYCKSCEKELREGKYKERVQAAAHRAYERNKKVRIERARHWVEHHRERRRTIVRAYNSRRRAWEYGESARFTPQEWDVLRAKFDYTCLRCGRKEPEIKLSPDHVIPLSRGGINSIDNIQPLCRECNAWKFTQSIDFRSGTGQVPH